MFIIFYGKVNIRISLRLINIIKQAQLAGDGTYQWGENFHGNFTEAKIVKKLHAKEK